MGLTTIVLMAVDLTKASLEIKKPGFGSFFGSRFRFELVALGRVSEPQPNIDTTRVAQKPSLAMRAKNALKPPLIGLLSSQLNSTLPIVFCRDPHHDPHQIAGIYD